MKMRIMTKAVLIGLCLPLMAHNVSAATTTVTISASGNSNSQGVVEAWCLNSGTSCKVTGNRAHHPGPRSCSMTCDMDEITVFSCSPNNNDRWIDSFNLPASAVAINTTAEREVYGWIVSGSTTASCSYTD